MSGDQLMCEKCGDKISSCDDSWSCTGCGVIICLTCVNLCVACEMVLCDDCFAAHKKICPYEDEIAELIKKL